VYIIVTCPDTSIRIQLLVYFSLIYFISNGFVLTDISVMENYESATQLSEIQSFYNDTTIFLTGATGFMGNLILDKLIR